jgi:hypothetical protein
MTITPFCSSQSTYSQRKATDSDKKKGEIVHPYDFKANRTVRASIQECSINTIVSFVAKIFGLNDRDTRMLLPPIDCMRLKSRLELDSMCLISDYWCERALTDEINNPTKNSTERNRNGAIDRLEYIEVSIPRRELKIEQLMKNNINAFASLLKTRLEQAHVSSFAELYSKSNLIFQHKQAAEKKYLRNSVNIDSRRQIDLITFPDDEATKQLVNDYWNAINNNEIMIENHQLGEKLLREFLTQFDVCKEKIFVTLTEQREVHPYGTPFNYPIKLNEQLNQAFEIYLDQFCKDFLTLSYSLSDLSMAYHQIKAKWLLISTIHKFIRMFLKEDYPNIEKQFNKAVEKYRSYESSLPLAHSKIENCEQKIAENVAMERRSDQLEKELSTLQKSLEGYRCFISEINTTLLTWTEREFALLTVWDDPAIYLPVLEHCKETDNEWLMIKSTQLKWGKILLTSPAGGQLIDRDVDIDLSQIEDPLDYFQNLLRERDIECLALDKAARPPKKPKCQIGCCIL